MKLKIKIEYHDNGSIWYKYYTLKNTPHREDGPALTYYDYFGNVRRKIYYINGKRHREDGSAVSTYDENGKQLIAQYYINGNELTESEWLIYQRKRKLKSFSYR